MALILPPAFLSQYAQLKCTIFIPNPRSSASASPLFYGMWDAFFFQSVAAH
jgi:hypothetical protein